MRPQLIGKKILAIGLHIIFIFVALIQVYPLIWLAFFSLKDNAQIFGGNVAGFPQPVIWGNYNYVATKGNVGIYFLNSLIVTIATLALSSLLIAMSAYGLVRMRWKLQNAVYFYLLLGLMIPIHAVLLPLFIVLQNLSMINTYWALVIPYTVFAIPFGISVMRSTLLGIPKEIEESACIDGCNAYRMFFRIVFPLLRGSLVTISIFTFLSCWNELMLAITYLNKQNLKTLTAGVMSLCGQFSTDWGIIGAGLFITVLPVLIFYCLIGKKIQGSLLAGAIKG
ncbi:carbohydrate ABC transporter permease [Yeguia hominis]|uniref:Carbohydrate ABC transporter permease n=1 Tax=Yeguia hominis TaxID=2763662 RepID=A0A926DA91_9FIRM|nr:carbohydrate ABC transporter permease [Yeguia hominis]MBC8533250.1 carbohydrate ABC transporter permease [Yeguia hominis]